MPQKCRATVEPRLSGLGIFFLIIQKMGVSLKCAYALQLLLWRQACLSSAHAQTTMWHCNKVGGSRCGLPIRLSGLPLEPRCPYNRGCTVYGINTSPF